MQTGLCDKTSHLCDNSCLTLIWACEKKKPNHLLIGSRTSLCSCLASLGRLEPAIHRTAMNPDSFGKGFNGAPLLQVNFDHLLRWAGKSN